MTVRAIYEDGVLKPKEPLPLQEHEEVEIEVRPAAGLSGSPQDPKSFVGFMTGGIRGMPVAAHHDKFLDQDQYAHLKAYLRMAMSSLGWADQSEEKKLQAFVAACKTARPDLEDLWNDMDRIPLVWSNAFDFCAQAIEREGHTRRG